MSKTSTFTKAMSMLLAVLMVLSLLPVMGASAAATPPAPTGNASTQSGIAGVTTVNFSSASAFLNAITGVEVNGTAYTKESSGSAGYLDYYSDHWLASANNGYLKFSGTTLPATVVVTATGYNELTFTINADKTISTGSGGSAPSTPTPDTPTTENWNGTHTYGELKAFVDAGGEAYSDAACTDPVQVRDVGGTYNIHFYGNKGYNNSAYSNNYGYDSYTLDFDVYIRESVIRNASITLNPTSVSIDLSGSTNTAAVTATVEGCTVSGVSSSNTSVVTVNRNGNTITVTGVSAGTATITVSGAGNEGYNDPDPVTFTVTVTAPGTSMEDGLTVSKSADKAGETIGTSDTVTLDMEAYATGTTVTSSTTVETSSPMDILLVLDNTYSMTSAYDNTTRLAAMQSAAKEFVNDLAVNNDSKIAMVSFVIGNRQSPTTTDVEWRTLNASAKTTVNNRIDGLTAPDSTYGYDTCFTQPLQTAASMLNQVSNDSNKKIVVFFTDGAATESASTIQSLAGNVKASADYVFSIGITANYGDAEKAQAVASSSEYYYDVTNANTLSMAGAFSRVSQTIETITSSTSVTLDANSVFQDVINTEKFDVSGATATVAIYDYDNGWSAMSGASISASAGGSAAKSNWTNNSSNDGTLALNFNANGTVTVTGFSYKDHYLPTNGTEAQNVNAQKVHLTISGLKLKANAQTAEQQNNVPTNVEVSSGVFAKSGDTSPAVPFPVPTVNIAAKTEEQPTGQSTVELSKTANGVMAAESNTNSFDISLNVDLNEVVTTNSILTEYFGGNPEFYYQNNPLVRAENASISEADFKDGAIVYDSDIAWSGKHGKVASGKNNYTIKLTDKDGNSLGSYNFSIGNNNNALLLQLTDGDNPQFLVISKSMASRNSVFDIKLTEASQALLFERIVNKTTTTSSVNLTKVVDVMGDQVGTVTIKNYNVGNASYDDTTRTLTWNIDDQGNKSNPGTPVVEGNTTTIKYNNYATLTYTITLADGFYFNQAYDANQSAVLTYTVDVTEKTEPFEVPTVKVLKASSNYIADFNAPLILATEATRLSDAKEGTSVNSLTPANGNGTFTLADGQVAYKLDNQSISGKTAVINHAYTTVDSAWITGKHVEDGAKAEFQNRLVNVVPASSVYYSDKLDTAVTVGDGSGYNDEIRYDTSDAAQANVDGTFYLTFYGTSIDVYCTTHEEGGYVSAAVFSGSGQSACVKDNRIGSAKTVRNYSSVDYYNTPSVSFTGLTAGTYTLKLVANDNAQFKLDGVRIYNPVQAGSAAETELNKTDEANANYLNLRKVLLNDTGIGGFTVTKPDGSTDTVGDAVSGVLFIDDMSGIKTMSHYKQVYNKDKKIWENEKDADGKLIWYEEELPIYATEFDAYKANGPKNEIYLDGQQGITFQLSDKVPVGAKVWIGLSAPKTGSGSVTITGRTKSGSTELDPLPVTSVMDMYYDFTVPASRQITITNQAVEDSGDIISVTNLKITGIADLIPQATGNNQDEVQRAVKSVFKPVTMKSVRLAANNGVDPEAVEEPAVEPTATPEPAPTAAPDVMTIVRQIISIFMSRLFGSASRLFR